MNECQIAIVGAGPAGCFAAYQLARQGADVVVIEPSTQGCEESTDFLRPAQWIRLLGSANDWNHSTEPIETLAGRTMRWPRGK